MFDYLLSALLDITQSSFGFIHSALLKADGTPYLKVRIIAVTDRLISSHLRGFTYSALLKADGTSSLKVRGFGSLNWDHTWPCPMVSRDGSLKCHPMPELPLEFLTPQESALSSHWLIALPPHLTCINYLKIINRYKGELEATLIKVVSLVNSFQPYYN